MENSMGKVEAEITLKNAGDVTEFRRGHCKEEDVRQITVKALVDTGASTLIINEAVRHELGLAAEGKRRTVFANGGQEECVITEPVNIRWKDRDTTCRAVVIPRAASILLGAIPLEDMDLIVEPLKQELIGAHGDVVEAMAL
jgi:clan AA aspartic protease